MYWRSIVTTVSTFPVLPPRTPEERRGRGRRKKGKRKCQKKKTIEGEKKRIR